MRSDRIRTGLVLFLLASLCCWVCAGASVAQGGGRLLVVVDAQTHAQQGAAFESYRRAVEADGLRVEITAGEWQRPEQVRQLLQRAHADPADGGLRGAFLVGRIPVPMLRDAQHLTSAFKMDQQRYPWRRSSVPSDRYYDDFDLSWDFLRQDEEEPLLFYYSLRADSPQRVQKEIYTARLFPPDEGEKGSERIGRYLERVAARRRGETPIRRMLLVGGHGYNSESLNAWTDEHLQLREQLPQLFAPGGRLLAWYHAGEDELESIVLRELVRQPLQLALFHAHGAFDTQYLLGAPEARTVPAQKDALRLYLRQRLRKAKEEGKSVAEEQLRWMQTLDVPLSWFEGAFDDATIAADTALLARQDLLASEVQGARVRADVVLFDSCFNGRFFERPCVANEYVMGPGEVVCGIANTVNVLQDIDARQDLELLGRGARIGDLHVRRAYLESHLIGDPTWRFAPNEDAPPAGGYIARIAALRAQLAARDFAPLPSRLEDPCEFVRRKAAFALGDVGDERVAAALVDAFVHDPSPRVRFVAQSALHKLAPPDVRSAWDTLLARDGAALPAEPAWRDAQWRKIDAPSWRARDVERLQDPAAPLAQRIGAARSFRNLRAHHLLPVLLAQAEETKNPPELRVCVLEALGWFQYSHRRAEILESLERILSAADLPEAVAQEAAKTRRRLHEGPNEPLTP